MEYKIYVGNLKNGKVMRLADFEYAEKFFGMDDEMFTDLCYISVPDDDIIGLLFANDKAGATQAYRNLHDVSSSLASKCIDIMYRDMEKIQSGATE